MASRDAPSRRAVSSPDLADLYRNRRSAVHAVVLSMREDFYVELDSFRDDIPTIVQRESSLRLRWFSPDNARDAITEPLEVAGVEIESIIVERLVDELCRRQGLAERVTLSPELVRKDADVAAWG